MGSRIIKFRAWIEEPGGKPQMVDDVGIIPEGEKKDNMPMTISSTGIYVNPFCDWIWLMQFTGHTNNDGTEIYAGDVITVQPYTDEIYQVVVRYKNGGFVIPCSDWNEFDMTLLGWTINMYGSHAIKVIGNIHSNPELLENYEKTN